MRPALNPEDLRALAFMCKPGLRDRLLRTGIVRSVVDDVFACCPVDGAKFARELLGASAEQIAALNAAKGMPQRASSLDE